MSLVWGKWAADPAGYETLPQDSCFPRGPHSQSLRATLSGGGSSGKRPLAPRSSSSRSSGAGRGGGARGVRMARSGRREMRPAGEGPGGERRGLHSRPPPRDGAREPQRPEPSSAKNTPHGVKIKHNANRGNNSNASPYLIIRTF